ncbi:hypothetical protein K3495_g12585 [Podosphaera aphanis]|nr:hypothetical protein K3495_g12585 [Podosphaera aphanis]
MALQNRTKGCFPTLRELIAPNGFHSSLLEAEAAIWKFSKREGFAINRSLTIKNKDAQTAGYWNYVTVTDTNCKWEAVVRLDTNPKDGNKGWIVEVTNEQHYGHKDPFDVNSNFSFQIRVSQKPRKLPCIASLRLIFFLDALEVHEVDHRALRSEDGKIQCSFIAPRISIKDTRNSSANAVFMDLTHKKNMFKMPLFHVVGVGLSQQCRSHTFCFMSDPNEPSNFWPLSKFSDSYSAVIDRNKMAVFTDREPALITAIDCVFSNAFIVFRLRPMEKSIESKAKPHFTTPETHKAFLKLWSSLINSETQSNYD